MENEKILVMKNISKSFPGVKALSNVDLTVKKGEVHALMGENGAGKSTLLKILAGAYTRDAGEIYIEGEKVDNLTPKRAEDLGISIIYQEFSCLPDLSIAENIFLGRQYTKRGGMIDWKRCREESEKLLKQVGIELDSSMKVSQLKVAEQQMVEIAKALSKNAKIIVMDEPTAPLTQKEIDHLFRVISDLKKKNIAVIYVSHRLAEIQEICDRLTVLRDGCLIGSANVSDVTVQDMIRMMVGRELKDMYPRADRSVGEEVLRIENLTTKDKLKNITLSVHKGEILGLAGLVGAGRTELARAVFGADEIESGTVSLNGEKLNIRKPGDAIAKKIGLVPEDRKQQGLVLMMNVKENISLSSLKKFKKGGKLSLKKEAEKAREYVDKLSVATPDIYTKVENLSGGNQQKVVLGKWLCADCGLLIIDEPTRGIDVGSKVEIYELMKELVEKDMAILMISSEMPELIGVCNRIAVMHEGELMGVLDRDEFSEEKIMAYASGQTTV